VYLFPHIEQYNKKSYNFIQKL